MSTLTVRASGAGVLDCLQVLRSAPTPLRGAPTATWTQSLRTGAEPLRVPGPGLQPWLHDTTTTRTDPAGSTLATLDFRPKDGVHLSTRAEEAYQFLCGAGDDNRAVLEFWCFVAGYSPDQVMSTARARSVCAWPVWWRAHGKLRLKQIRNRCALVRPMFVSVSASGPPATEEESDGWGPVLSTGGLT